MEMPFEFLRALGEQAGMSLPRSLIQRLWTLREGDNKFPGHFRCQISIYILWLAEASHVEKESQFLTRNFPINVIVGNEQPTNQMLGHLFYISVPNSL